MQSYDLSNVSVLVVEKYPQMRTLLRQVLRQFGISNVFDAASPAIGYERFQDASPDIVMSDWSPDFDGLGLVMRIRSGQQATNPWAPVIMCTANTERHHILEARDAGATEFLAKPVSAKSIYDRLVAVVDDARAFVRTETFIGPDRRRHDGPYNGDERRKENKAMVIGKKQGEEIPADAPKNGSVEAQKKAGKPDGEADAPAAETRTDD